MSEVCLHVVPLEKPTAYINKDAIKFLEEALEEFKTGAAKGLALVVVESDGSTVRSAYAHGGEYHACLSGTTRLMVRLSQEQD